MSYFSLFQCDLHVLIWINIVYNVSVDSPGRILQSKLLCSLIKKEVSFYTLQYVKNYQET